MKASALVVFKKVDSSIGTQLCAMFDRPWFLVGDKIAPIIL